MLGLALAAQALRWWAVTSLGPAWNVRVIVVPGAPLVTRGPYRYLRHPNYLAVALEGIAVPLIHTAWLTALSFSIANAALLAVRIRSEEQALACLGAGAEQLAGRPRFLPMRPQPQPR
jgi:methyltransferase